MLLLWGEQEVDGDAKHFNFSSSYHMLRRVLCWLSSSHRVNLYSSLLHSHNLPPNTWATFSQIYLLYPWQRSHWPWPLARAGKATGGYQGRYNLPAHNSVWISLIRVRLESMPANPSLCVRLLPVKRLVFFCVRLLPQLFGRVSLSRLKMAGPVLSSLTYRGQPLLIYEKSFRAWSPPPFNSFLAFVKF